MRRETLAKSIVIPAGTVVTSVGDDEDYVVTIPLPRGERIRVSLSEESLRQLNLLNHSPSIL